MILGHSGFIGSHLIKRLLRTKCWDVKGQSLPNIDLSKMDDVFKLAQHFLPDTTLVLAAAVKRQFGDTLQTYRKNMAIIENICHVLKTNPVRKVVFISSAAVYGEETENMSINELTPVNPTSYYGISKYASECLLRKACSENQHMSLACLRPPLVYGESDQGRTYGPAGFCASALAEEAITLWGDGAELREFLYIDDLCRVIEHVSGGDFEGELNVVSGVSYSFLDVITTLKTMTLEVEVNSRPRSKQKVNNVFDPQKIRSLLPSNFRFTSLEEGLRKMFV